MRSVLVLNLDGPPPALLTESVDHELDRRQRPCRSEIDENRLGGARQVPPLFWRLVVNRIPSSLSISTRMLSPTGPPRYVIVLVLSAIPPRYLR
jgi:hypothetical protein